MRTILRLGIIFLFCIFINLMAGTVSYGQMAEFDNAGAIIEYDSIEMSASGKKASLIKFHFKRKYRVSIQTSEAAEAYNQLSIPESFDPALIFHAPEHLNIGKHFANINVENFKIRILKSDGTIISPEDAPRVEIFKSLDLAEDKFGNYERYIYEIDLLQPGDILELEYHYSILYVENLVSLLTTRFFFHDDYPVLKKDLAFLRAKNLEAEVNTINATEAVVEEKENRTIYRWHFENLPGCMQESGSRPYKSLPYVIISIRPYEMLYTVPYSFEERFVPFYVFGPGVREKDHLKIARALVDGVNTRQYNQVRSYIQKRTEGVEDSTGYTQLFMVQNYIAENFTFDPDFEYYERLDIRKERMGDFLTQGVIRGHSRYNVYVALIAGLNLSYFTAYLADTRTGEITEEYFEPTLTNDNLFAVLLSSGQLQYIYPKREDFGYFLNELPFYFENAVVRLIYLDDFRNIKEAIKENFRAAVTPKSSFSDNSRMQIAKVEIDVDALSASVNANISLAGQFSTLGRGAYIYKSCDPTVNQLYCSRFWENISPDIIPTKTEVLSVNESFPFKAKISASFIADGFISKDNDTLVLDLGGWFTHITDLHLNVDQRIMSYYPDFQYTDTYTYQFIFDSRMELLNAIPPVKISNDYGIFTFNCVPGPDGSILLSSKVIINSDEVLPEKIMDVGEIQKQMMALNQMKVKLLAAE